MRKISLEHIGRGITVIDLIFGPEEKRAGGDSRIPAEIHRPRRRCIILL